MNIALPTPHGRPFAGRRLSGLVLGLSGGRASLRRKEDIEKKILIVMSNPITDFSETPRRLFPPLSGYVLTTSNSSMHIPSVLPNKIASGFSPLRLVFFEPHPPIGTQSKGGRVKSFSPLSPPLARFIPGITKILRINSVCTGERMIYCSGFP